MKTEAPRPKGSTAMKRAFKFSDIKNMLDFAEIYAPKMGEDGEESVGYESFFEHGAYSLQNCYDWAVEKGDKAFWDTVLGSILNAWNDENITFSSFPFFIADYMRGEYNHSEEYSLRDEMYKDFANSLRDVVYFMLADSFIHTVPREAFDQICSVLCTNSIPAGTALLSVNVLSYRYENPDNVDYNFYNVRQSLKEGNA